MSAENAVKSTADIVEQQIGRNQEDSKHHDVQAHSARNHLVDHIHHCFGRTGDEVFGNNIGNLILQVQEWEIGSQHHNEGDKRDEAQDGYIGKAPGFARYFFLVIRV